MMMLLWPLALVVFVLLLIPALRGRDVRLPMFGCMMGHGDMDHGSQANSAIDIVRQRYARGDIDREEYERMLRDLSY